MNAMKTITVMHRDTSVSVLLFRNRDLRLGHVFKHFLNPSEPWQTLDGITFSKGARIRARKAVSRTGCAGESHRPGKCKNYTECTPLLENHAPGYIDKTVSVLRETADTGAVLFCGEKAPMVCLSAEGVLVIARKLPGSQRTAKWNTVTCYLPYDNRYEFPSDTTPYERFVTAVDHVYRKFCRNRTRSHFTALNSDLWNSYFQAVHARSRTP